MTSITGPMASSLPSAAPDPAALVTPTPTGPLRRTALVAAGVLACALPVVFTVNVSRMLLTGIDTDHRFHQATGQGLVLFAFWLVPLAALLRAGWAGRRPSTATGYQHLAFVALGAASAVAAPQGGAPFLVGVIALTGALLWVALPQRPRLRTRIQIDPLLAPIALLAAAVFVPYAVQQIGLQHEATGYHAQNPHLFDMAWLVLTAVVVAALAALAPAVRGLVGWLAGCSATIGVAGLAFGEDATWSLLVLGLGVAAAAGWWFVRRTDRTRTAA